MFSLFVPGRVCLFGEHSDWAGGYRVTDPTISPGFAIIVGTCQGVYADVEPTDDMTLHLTSTSDEGTFYGPKELRMEPDILQREAATGGFWSYQAGVAAVMLRKYGARICGGLRISNNRTDLPVKKGLSSSAAVCVLTARAFSRAYDLGLSLTEEMEVAYLGEIATPSRCGRMDQGCAYGRVPVLLTFDGDRLETRPLRIGRPLFLIVADLGSSKDTRRILAALNACFPATATDIAAGVRKLLGPTNARMIAEAEVALAAGDAQALGALMSTAQAEFDRYAGPACPDQLTAPVLHRVLQAPALQPHIYGGKGVGSQGDGSVQFVARSEADQMEVVRLCRETLDISAFPLTLRPE